MHQSLNSDLSRRSFIQRSTGFATALLGGVYSLAQPRSAQASPIRESVVSFRNGTDRRDIVPKLLKPFEEDIIRDIGNKQVVIKANAGLAEDKYADRSTHVEHLRGILDFLEPIYDRQIIVTEGTAGAKCSAFIGFENYGYMPLEREYNVRLVDANDLPYERHYVRAGRNYPQPINIISIFTDPDVYIISAARMKTHNAVVGTFSLKNVAMGAPVCHYNKKGNQNINEKSFMHGGKDSSGGRELSYNLFTLALLGARPDLSVVDGVQAIEGDGPWGGDVVDHGIMLASTDFVAADRLCTELTGIDPFLMKYLEWCSDADMGTFDLKKIKVIGDKYHKHIKKYKLNKNFDWQVEWIYENFEKS